MPEVTYDVPEITLSEPASPAVSSLPPEVFIGVFQHLRRAGTSQDLARVGLASWQFNALIAPLLFHTIIADNERYLDSLHSALLRDPSRGELVRNLVFPRVVPIIAQDEDSGEALWWIDLHVTVLQLCPALESLEIQATSVEIADAIPWGTLKRLSLGTRTPSVLRSIVAKCNAIEHLNLVDMNILMEHSHDVLTDPELVNVQHLAKLSVLSIEWTDPKEMDRVYLAHRTVDVIRRVLDAQLPDLKRILVLLYAKTQHSLALPPHMSMMPPHQSLILMSLPNGGWNLLETAAHGLLKPLKSLKIFVAGNRSPSNVWKRSLVGKINYATVGERVCSEADLE
ncbi:hypothetical protein EXIGLDRAFT_731279 [Exidia glandulosa HHB12029]|uniref:F-box domain-containing protein n=1 Tax=Exidia glandulosa HHB12029 TaxID=1314781 RepID=A0A165L3A1_EXIGL|nr:hypothetical protein EXIGLDRAFT_731279 [Exidia glandulosa HHB12029]